MTEGRRGLHITVLGVFGQGQLAESLSYGLTQLGHTVSAVSEQPVIPGTKLGRLLARKRPELLRFTSNRGRQTALADALIATRPDLVLAVKCSHVSGAVIDRVRARTGARMLNWYPDNPFVPFGQTIPLGTLRHYDRVVVFSPQLRTSVKERLGLEAQYIPFGFDPRYYFPPREPRRVLTDVAFVGAHRPERAALVARLIESGFSVRVAGPGWSRASEPVRSTWEKVATWGADASHFYHQARVGLNDLHKKSNAHSHNMRSWEIPATGIPMVTTDSAHQRQLLGDLPGIGFYRNLADLPAAVQTMMARGDRGLPADLSAHTYEHRCRELVAAL